MPTGARLSSQPSCVQARGASATHSSQSDAIVALSACKSERRKSHVVCELDTRYMCWSVEFDDMQEREKMSTRPAVATLDQRGLQQRNERKTNAKWLDHECTDTTRTRGEILNTPNERQTRRRYKRHARTSCKKRMLRMLRMHRYTSVETKTRDACATVMCGREREDLLYV